MLSRRSPEAVIEPSGNASAAATPSLSGESRPIVSMDGNRTRIVMTEVVSRAEKQIHTTDDADHLAK